MKQKILTFLVGLAFVFIGTSLTQSEKQSDSVLEVYSNTDITIDEEIFETKSETVELESAVLQEKIATYPEFIFEEMNSTVYVIEDVIIKDNPYDDANEIISLKKYDEIQLIGKNDLKYWKVNVDGNEYYIDSSKITLEKSVIDEMKAEEEKIAKEEAERKAREEREKNSYNYTWNGSKLTAKKGVNYGPTGKETYYNLDMSGVIRIMRRMGYTGEYWVREDGVKMLGNYIMCAANLDVFPRGSLVESSLGTCIVCDTGGFAVNNPYQLDIAVTW